MRKFVGEQDSLLPPRSTATPPGNEPPPPPPGNEPPPPPGPTPPPRPKPGPPFMDPKSVEIPMDHKIRQEQNTISMTSTANVAGANTASTSRLASRSQVEFEQNGAISNYHFSGGNYLGELDSKGNIFLKDQHFSAPDAKSSTSTTSYNARSGDTLRSIAKLFYGTEDYWYLIADINGLDGDEPIQPGTVIDVPARANTTNKHDQFKPMDLAQIIGDTTPTLPFVPPPPKAGCNPIASIIMIVVAVVVTIYTAGAAATWLGPALGKAGAAIAGGAIGGFVGSVASQATGVILGVQNGISLKQAFVSGLTTAATAGIGEALGVGEAIGQGVEHTGTFTEVVDGITELNYLGRAIQAGGTVVAGYAANKLVGNQASFSWRNVATSAVAAGVGSAIGLDSINLAEGGVSTGDIFNDTLQGIAHAGIGYGVGKLIQRGDDRPSWNFGEVALDSFGNAVGNSINDYIKTQEEVRLINQAIGRMSEATGNRITDNILGESSIQIASQNAAYAATASDRVLDPQMASIAAQNDKELIENQRKRNANVDRANARNAQLADDAAALDARHRTMKDRISTLPERGQAAFDAGVTRGEHRTNSLKTVSDQERAYQKFKHQADSYIDFRKGQRADFESWYNELSGIGRLAFDGVASVANTASDIIFGPNGAPNAIETELNAYANIPLFEAGGALSITVDSYGRYTTAFAGTASLTSDISANFGTTLGYVKGYGADSFDLGVGESLSTTADVSITELVVDKNSDIGKLLKARPVDLFAGIETGYTQKGSYWNFGQEANVVAPTDQYFYKGGYAGASIGWQGLYKLDASPIYKGLGLESWAFGRTYEIATPIESLSSSEPSVLGRIIYNISNMGLD